nr:uncharacterized protein CI109_002121 [Kwoniella shandongensis]KAA5529695.1 hypothetical protein CI109_002121 [Kwoniella shandongensis]
MSPITDPTPRSNPNPSKQRKLNRSLPQLKRNAACLPCRRRRIKCDAGKPHCSSCVRSYHFLARTHPDEERDAKGIQCFYDDEALEGDEEDSSVDKEHVLPTHRDKGSKRKERAEDEDPQDVIKRLENKVFELQQALSSTSTAPPLSADNTGSASGPNSVPRTASSTSASLKEPRLWSGPFETPTNIMKGDTPTNILKEVYNSAMGSFTSDPPSIDFDFGMPSAAGDSINGAGFAASVAGGIDDEAGKMGGAFLDLLWPGWPPTLPTPAMVDHLVETFFTMVPSIGRIIHRQTFLTRLALPPTHADFPHRALLHAMCAAASSYSAAVKVRSGQENVAKYSDDSRRARGKGFDVNISDDPCFSERNAMYAIAALKYDHMNGKGLFDLVQAMLILAHWSQSNARWIDGWMLIGAATRLVVCLGLLNQNPDISFSMPTIKKSILDPPKNDAEREERIATVFYVFFFDVSSSASSGWPCCLPIDELNSKLPGSREEFDLGMYINKNPQSFHSPEFYTSHPVPDGYVMLVKSNALLMRATKFTRRCRSMDPSERLLACQLPEFRQIDSDIAAFGLSFPPSLRDPVQYRNGYSKGIDADLISAHLVPHIAAIFLHEPFADLADPQCPSTTRILSEARAVLNIVYLIVSSSADISYMLLPMASL